jgi:alpha-acetolactate decarboxylase
MQGRMQRVDMAACCGLLLIASGCVAPVPHGQLTRWPAVSGVARSQDATFPAWHLRRHGDLGAGTLAEGGGAVVLDGIYYYGATGEGEAFLLRSTEPLASGWAVRFRPDLTEVQAAGFSHDALQARLAVGVPDRSLACAFRLIGRFAEVRLDSGVTLSRVSGMIIGFRGPDRTGGEALSLHWLSGDWLTGGRVADFRLIDGSLAIDLCPRDLRIYTATPQAFNRLRQ